MNPLPAIWPSWCFGWDSSALGLVNSWDSTMQPCFVFGTYWDASDPRSRCQTLSLFLLLQRITGAMSVSSFLLAFFVVLLILLIIQISEISSFQLSSIIQCRVFNRPFFVFLLSERLFQFLSKLQVIYDLVVQSFELLSISPRTTKNPFEGVSFNRVNFVKPVYESDKLLFKSTFQ